MHACNNEITDMRTKLEKKNITYTNKHNIIIVLQ